MNKSIREHYSDRISELERCKLSFSENEDADISVFNKEDKEIDLITLQLLIHMLKTLESKIIDNIDEPSKIPIDEFTAKRLGIYDHIIIKDRSTASYREFTEAYHDEYRIFTYSNTVVDLKRNVVSLEESYGLHLGLEEAKKLIAPLQKFIELNEKEDI